MNKEVTEFINNINQPWQVEVCNQIHQMIHKTISDIEERIQYRK